MKKFIQKRKYIKFMFNVNVRKAKVADLLKLEQRTFLNNISAVLHHLRKQESKSAQVDLKK